MLQKTRNGLYTFSAFLKFPELICGISTKRFGNMKASGVPREIAYLKFGESRRRKKFEKIFKEQAEVFQNQALFASALGIGQNRFVFMDQPHKSSVYQVFSHDANRFIQDADGLFTKESNLFLFVAVADCFPILAYDPVEKVIGATHAGWRGVKSGIAKNLVGQMEMLGSEPANVIVGIGPGICGKCYEVGKDVASQFSQRFLMRKDGKILLDLERAIVGELIQSGIKKENIDHAGICVFEDRNFFSARREGETARIAVVIGLR